MQWAVFQIFLDKLFIPLFFIEEVFVASKKMDTLRKKRFGNRPMSGRFYKTRFFIVAEGSQTERDYLTILRCLFNIVIMMPPVDTHSAPNHLLKKSKGSL